MRTKYKQHLLIHHTRSDLVFLTIDWVILIVFFVILIYPLAYILMSSFSAGSVYMNLTLIPSKFSLEGYRAVFQQPDILVGYTNSIIYTSTFTVISLIITICCAYPLSRKDFGGGGAIMVLCMITMYFSGGLIPTFLLIRQLKIIDTIWALILPGSLSVFNMIVMRTYFRTQIPDELHEASMLDGCTDLRFLMQVVLPLSGAIIAVIALYCAVSMWNDYFNPMIYITTRRKLPLPNFLREILMVNVQPSAGNMNQDEIENLTRMEQRKELLKYSLIIVASVPILMIYPFVQRHFVKGVMIGSVKG